MKQLSFTDGYSKPIVIALGFFDCIHIGHKTLIDRSNAIAAQKYGESCIFTFTSTPNAVLIGEDQTVFTFNERLYLLAQCGVDCVLSVNFDRKFMSLTASDFLELLTKNFNVVGVVCGHDYRFGAGAKGNAEFLKRFCDKMAVMCDIVQPVCINNRRISSTDIRADVCAGDMPSAEKKLGHRYFISGRVCHGRGVGGKFGFPTANLSYPADKLMPCAGVYATRTYVQGNSYKSVTNVGDCPTFGEKKISVETMLVDFDNEIYGEEMRVEFVRKLRDIRKFDTPADLRAQIMQDTQWR